uniref:BACK domain-containing protein n=1 Tax=Steinernema glaseri TaxID=37863 RepID=A0A1I7YR03_9BILA
MSSVPAIFRESVCSLLGQESLSEAQDIRDYVWSMSALNVAIAQENSDIYVLFEGRDEVQFISSPSWETIRKAKYHCLSLRVISKYFDETGPSKGSMRSLLGVKHIEELDIMDINYFDDYMTKTCATFLKQVSITSCKFRTSAPLSLLLKNVLQNKCLSKLTVSDNFIDEFVSAKDDFEEEVYDLLVHGRHLSHVQLHNNDSVKSLDECMLKRVLDHWINSEEGFPRDVEVYFSCHYNRTNEKIKRLCNCGEGGPRSHPSGRGHLVTGDEYDQIRLKFIRNLIVTSPRI